MVWLLGAGLSCGCDVRKLAWPWAVRGQWSQHLNPEWFDFPDTAFDNDPASLITHRGDVYMAAASKRFFYALH